MLSQKKYNDHTEDEAVRDWCPFTDRVTYGLGTQQTYANDRCLAAGCMAWRWGQDRIEDLEEVILPSNDKPEGKVLAIITMRGDNPSVEYGEEFWVQAPTVSSGFRKWTKHRKVRVGHCGRIGNVGH